MIFNTTIFGKKPSGSVVDTADATANANDIISPATAYVNGEKVTGTIPTKNAENVGASGDTVSIPAGYYPEVVDKKVEHTTQATPSVTLNSSTGKVTATATQTAGYVEAGTKTGELQLPIKSATDMTVSGATVTAPAGYYAADESKSVATATQATPSVTLNSDTGKVTATATQEAGYVSAGTKTGELQLDTKSSSNLTASGATVTAPAGYYPTAASKSVATATQATPSMSRSGATVTATVTQSAGYVSEGTKTNSLTVPSAGTLTGELTSTTGASWGSTVVGGIKRGTGKFGCTLNQSAGYTSGFSNDSGSFTCKLVSGGTVTPTTSTQSIVPAEYSAYGEIKVAGDANLKAANIRDGVSIFGVSGTYTGSTPSYATPSISVSSSGVITASANGKSATKTLSSSDDSDFIASNIKSGVNIFGVTGSLSGGGSFLTGVFIEIPIDFTSSLMHMHFTTSSLYSGGIASMGSFSAMLGGKSMFYSNSTKKLYVLWTDTSYYILNLSNFRYNSSRGRVTFDWVKDSSSGTISYTSLSDAFTGTDGSIVAMEYTQ